MAAAVPVGVYAIGWRHTMLVYAVFVVVMIMPLAALFLRQPPQDAAPAVFTQDRASAQRCSACRPISCWRCSAFGSFCAA